MALLRDDADAAPLRSRADVGAFNSWSRATLKSVLLLEAFYFKVCSTCKSVMLLGNPFYDIIVKERSKVIQNRNFFALEI